MRDGAAPAREVIYEALNGNVGILSLSEIADHELMWAHYAERHTGFVLGFDERHPFFNRKRSENDEFYYLRKVIYSDGPPSPSIADVTGDKLLVSKGSQWAYEREWRMLLPLKDAARSLSGDPEAIHLFSFPAQAVRSAILGANARPGLEAALRSVLARPELRHVPVSRAILDLNTRTVLVPSTSGGT
jgi:hypothetical protein